MPCITNTRQPTNEEIMVGQFRGYFTPAIASFGIVGNILVILTFTQMQRRHYSRFNIYVLCIAYSQTVDLIINALLDDFLGRGLYWISDCTIHIKLDTWSSFSFF
ncbi:hypothetical protein PHET_10203 [Paragonimus heterotremus]|uniref:G-protein coupled receptors family 1 profile domain-containing protein n=1 Tax=Paragonimus heterotremus TaxID=100268 RepID=A0A8J4SF62_9TREM|nr:hypothetical protein PHET_10203 [Paragonimus heterotremus]